MDQFIGFCRLPMDSHSRAYASSTCLIVFAISLFETFA
jgi:hypothetical protein